MAMIVVQKYPAAIPTEYKIKVGIKNNSFRDWRLEIGDSRLEIGDSRLEIRD